MSARAGSRLTPEAIVFLVLGGAIAVGAVLVAMQGRNFFSTGNLADVFTGMSVLGLFAIGQTVVILAGGLDLSVSLRRPAWRASSPLAPWPTARHRSLPGSSSHSRSVSVSASSTA